MKRKGDTVRLRHRKTGEERSLTVMLADSLQGYLPDGHAVKRGSDLDPEEGHYTWHRPEDWYQWNGLEWKKMK